MAGFNTNRRPGHMGPQNLGLDSPNFTLYIYRAQCLYTNKFQCGPLKEKKVNVEPCLRSSIEIILSFFRTVAIDIAFKCKMNIVKEVNFFSVEMGRF